MGDAENALPSSKKRAAGREISRDNPGLDDDEDTSEQETGTFKRASEEVLATRRIVKVRRSQTTATPSSNPFAGIRLVPNAGAGGTQADVTAEVKPDSEKASLDDVDGKTKSSEEKEKGEDEDSNQSESHVNKNEADKNSSAEEKSNVVSEAKEAMAANEPAAGEDKTDKYGKKDDAPAVRGDDKAENVDKKDDEPAVGEDKTENDKKKEEETKNVDQNAKSSGEKDEKKDEKTENVDPSTESSGLSSFQQLSSSQNAFTNLSGTGFSTSTFSFGSIAKDGSGSGSASLFGSKSDQPFGLGLSNNGNSSLFGTPGAPIVSKSEGSSFPSMHQVAVETGEEDEEVVFTADSILFEFIDGGWKERGKGELKINVSTNGAGKARLLMRARGNYRLILNAYLYADMKLTNMEKRGVTFACVNSTSEDKGGLSTFALKFKDGSIVEKFRTVVTEHKGKTPAAPAVLKTPENSPKASDE